MRIANLAGRVSLLSDGLAIDVERACSGRFGPDPQDIYSDFDAFAEWATTIDVGAHHAATEYRAVDLETPVPRPSQIFAIGLNYADHAAEAGLELPARPMVFTKFASSLAGAETTVHLSGEKVDWEAELVAVISRTARNIPAANAWQHVAGLSVGQDLSDRIVQNGGRPAQFSLGKSFAGYAPVGPTVVTVDEISRRHDLDDLALTCTLTDPDGTSRTMQNGSTADMVFRIPALIEYLSGIVELRAGDLLFTGTPAGVGIGRKPKVFLRAGQTVTTEIEGIGTIRQTLR